MVLFHALSDSSSKIESANDVTEVMVSWRDIENNLNLWPIFKHVGKLRVPGNQDIEMIKDKHKS